MKLTLLAATALLTTCYADTKPLYKDPKAPIDDRVADLLKRMTIEEKTSQILQGDLRNWLDLDVNKFNASGLAWSTSKRGGSYYVGIAAPSAWISEGIKKGQNYAMKETRLGIPPFVQTEGIHGLLAINATIFNSPIAHGCSFNPGLINKMAAAIAQESLAIGVNQILGPLADLARELRFGRVEETYGEDPFLAGEMAYEYVKGTLYTKEYGTQLTIQRSSRWWCKCYGQALRCLRNTRTGVELWSCPRRRKRTPNNIPSSFQACNHGCRSPLHHDILQLI